MNLRFHHLGIATADIKKYTEIFSNFGYSVSEIKVEPSQKVRLSFLSKSGGPSIELVEPIEEGSPVSRILKQFGGPTPYHICYEVDDIQEAIDEMEGLNFRPLFEPIESETMGNGLFCYLFSPDIGLIELYQKK